jgi:hypothetical protein
MTARAGDRWHKVRAGLALLALLVLVVLVVTSKRTPPPESADLPEPAGDVETPAGAPEPPPSPSPTAEPAGGQSSYVVPWSAAPTRAPEAPPTPAAPWAPPTPRPTPAPQPCVEYTWDVSDSPAVAGQILVEIRVRNRCGRVLQPLEVLFYAQGWRQGNAIYSAQGNLLEKIYPDSVRTVMVALPGSTSFYDRVEVTPINPPVR